MAQEFTIKSEIIESKINQLLPTQGGFQPGVDFSASTMIVPIVDLTESAEGSNLREDLQRALSHNSVTTFSVVNANTTIINTTGFYRVTGIYNRLQVNSTPTDAFALNDGSTEKNIFLFRGFSVASSGTFVNIVPFDFTVLLSAGDSLKCISGDSNCQISGSHRQIADVDGNLVNPT